MWLLSELGRDDRAVFKGGGVYWFSYWFSPRNVEKKIFGSVKKHANAVKCECWLTLCLHYCDAMKNHLALIKCKKPLGRPGIRPGPRWESLQRSPRPPSWWGGGCLSPTQEPYPALGLSGLAWTHPQIFWQCKKARPAKWERWRTLCLHYCDARKSHLASIKCKKPLGQPGLYFGPRWGELTALPQTPSWWGGGWSMPDPWIKLIPAEISRTADDTPTCPHPLIFTPERKSWLRPCHCGASRRPTTENDYKLPFAVASVLAFVNSITKLSKN